MYNCRLTDSLQTQCIYGPTAGIYLKLTYVMWLEITFHAQASLKWMAGIYCRDMRSPDDDWATNACISTYCVIFEIA